MMQRFALVALLSCAPAAAVAQTRFQWPSSTVDVATYTTVELCAAASARVRFQSEERKLQASGIWRDTLPFDPAELSVPYEPVVRETTRKCLARFANPDSVPADDFYLLFPLYLYADWDDKARALLRRRFASLGADAEKERLELIDWVTQVLVPGGPGVRPPRFEMVHDMITEQARHVEDRGKRLVLMQRPIGFAQRDVPQDTVLTRRAAARVRALADSLTPREWETYGAGSRAALQGADSVEHHFAERLSAIVEGLVGDRVLLDSLRRGNAAYEALQRSLFRRIVGQDPDMHPEFPPIGKRAPAIVADIWVGSDSVRSAPRGDRVSLVLFLNNNTCASPMSGSGPCANRLRTVERLMKRFPQLDVTVVAQTLGYFMYVKEGMTDSTEAALTRRLLDAHGVTARLAMKSTPYWRLPAPDRRRIDRDDVNVRSYTLGKRGYGAYIVDEDGIIVHAAHLDRHSEREFADRIEVLLQRRRDR